MPSITMYPDLPHTALVYTCGYSKSINAENSNPTYKERRLRRRRRAKRSYSTSKVRRGGREELPLVQGKEQGLHFAGATMKRYPMPKVRETQ